MSLPHRYSFAFALLTLCGAISTAVYAQPVAAQLAASSADTLELPVATEATLTSRYPRNVDDLRRIETQLQHVIQRAIPATVAVQLGMSAGSGVIVSPEGLVLTAGHVIGESSRRVSITLADGRRLQGRSLGANHDIDAGMVQIDNPPADLPYAPIAKGAPLKPGDWVVTTGQPGGLIDDRAPPVRLGRVLFRDEEVVCTDCTLVGGDSGGPLFNMRGEVVGIHSSIGPRVTHNFHVATTGFSQSWDRLLAGEVWGGDFDENNVEKRPLIGVSGRTVDGRCVITNVIEGLPADKAGLLIGDVVTAIDGREISSFDELSRAIFFQELSKQVRLTIERDGKRLRMDVEVVRLSDAEPK